MTTVVCAPNAYKGALAAAAAAAAMAEGVRAALPEAVTVQVPVADGGDGTLDVLVRAAGPRGRMETHAVTGPLGDPMSARLGWLDDHIAVVEMAEASGLRLLPRDRLDALTATSRGTGELLRAALDRGARRIVVGIGGSASTDGGGGLLAALGLRLLDGDGHPLPDGGGALVRLAHLDASGLDPRVRSVAIEVAVDVASPLLGLPGAAAIFGPQKGASPEQVALLEEGLRRFAEVAARDLGVPRDLTGTPGAGAAGGCGYGLAAVCGAALRGGAALVCDLVGLDEALRGATLVLTGEGRLDASTAAGKAPAEVARRARRAGVPCVALAGAVEQPVPDLYAAAVAISEGLALDEALPRTAELLRDAATRVLQRMLPGTAPQ